MNTIKLFLLFIFTFLLLHCSSTSTHDKCSIDIDEQLWDKNDSILNNKINEIEKNLRDGLALMAENKWQLAKNSLQSSETFIKDIIESQIDTIVTDPALIKRSEDLFLSILSSYMEILPHLDALPEDVSKDEFGQIMEEEIAAVLSLPGLDSLGKSILLLIDTTQFDMNLELNKKVINCIKFFMGNGRKPFNRWLKRSGKYMGKISDELELSGLPTTLAYLPLIESGYNAKAFSRARASGMWQFMSFTGKRFGLEYNYWLDERRNIEKSTKAAIKYFTFLNNKFKDWNLALAAYNCGEGRIRGAIRRQKTRNYWDLKLAPETMNYVPLFMAASIIARDAKKFGFDSIFDSVLITDTVTINYCMDLRTVANLCSTSLKTIKSLNPEIRRWCTPPKPKNGKYLLSIPKNSRNDFLKLEKEIPDSKKIIWQRYRIKSGDNLSIIAGNFNIPVDAIKTVNNLKSTRIRSGKYLLIPIPRDKKVFNKKKIFKKSLTEFPVHIVRTGETVSEIADFYNVKISNIKKWNSLNRRARIKHGQKLIVGAKKTKLKKNAPRAEVSKSILDNTKNYEKKIYIVKRGDNLHDIAADYSVKVRDLIEWNSKNSNIIRPGEKLLINMEGQNISYIVRTGDNLWKISQKFGVSVDIIKQNNGIKNSKLKIGQKLIIRKK